MEDQAVQGVPAYVSQEPLSGEGVPSLDTDPWDHYPVYHRAFLTREDKLCIVTLQKYDEDDYDKARFLQNRAGDRMYWYSEDEAKQWLNENFKPEFILEEDRVATPLSVQHMRR